MAELSEDEIDAMFSEEEGRKGASGGAASWDFSVPSPIPVGHEKTLSLIHENYATNVMMMLSSFLRTDVHIALDHVEQMSYGQFVDALINPTCLASFDMSPLSGHGLIDITPVLLFGIVNRMVGGGLDAPKIDRAFTELELSVINRLLKLFLKELGNAWNFILKIHFNLKDTHTNPDFVRIISDNELCVIVTLKMRLPDAAGFITICIPYTNLEPISRKLGGTQWGRYGAKQSDDVIRAHQENFKNLEVEIEALLGEINLSMSEVLALQEGDVLDLGVRAKHPLALRVAGEEKFLVSPGLVGRYKGVKIKKAILKGVGDGQ